MSQENVEIVRQIYQAFAADGVEAALPYMAPDSVLYPFPQWPGPSEYHSRDGLRRLLAEWTENFGTSFELEIHEIRAGRGQGAAARRDGRENQRLGCPGPPATRGHLLGLSRQPASARAVSSTPGVKPSKPPGCRSRRKASARGWARSANALAAREPVDLVRGHDVVTAAALDHVGVVCPSFTLIRSLPRPASSLSELFPRPAGRCPRRP